MDKNVKMVAALSCSTTSINEQSTMPFEDSQMRQWGYVAWRCLDDGTVLAVGPMLFGNGRLYVDVHAQGHADCYCYDDLEVAIAALQAFMPNSEEPTGWKRHPATGRRRPRGDPSKEYVER